MWKDLVCICWNDLVKILDWNGNYSLIHKENILRNMQKFRSKITILRLKKASKTYGFPVWNIFVDTATFRLFLLTVSSQSDF